MTTDELIDGLRVAMLGTDEGGFVDSDSDIPAGEMFRLAAEYMSTVFEQAQAEHAKRIELTPPSGWFVFGTHVDQPVALEFYGSEFTESGMPMWERPAQAESEWEYLVDPRGYAIYRHRKAVPVGPWEPVEANE